MSESSSRIDRQAPWPAATTAGVLGGIAYWLSPVAIYFVVLSGLLAWWSGRGLRGRERTAVVTLVSLSLIVRALAVALFFLATNHRLELYGILIGDEKLIHWRAIWLRNLAFDVPISPEGYRLTYQAYGETGLAYLFGYVHVLFGVSPYGLHLLNILIFIAAAVVMHRLVRPAYGALPAFAGLLLVVTLPSFFAWSISVLKEPAYFLLIAVAMWASVTVLRGRTLMMRIAALVIGLLALDAVSTIRSVGRVISVGGLGLGLAARMATWRAWICLGAVVLAALVSVKALQRPDVQEKVFDQFKIAATSQIGNAETEGYGYLLLDRYYYSRWFIKNDLSYMTGEEAMRYAVRAVLSVFLVPLPWQMLSRSALAFMPEQVLWYLATPLAFIGFVAGVRRDPLITWLLAGYTVVAAIVISLPSGNIGTFIRMRDMFVPTTFWLSALGGAALLENALHWLGYHRAETAVISLSETSPHALAR